MEAITPEGLEPDAFGFGGNGQVVVWALLENDDDDGEMLQMTALLKTLLAKTGSLATCVESTKSVSGAHKKLGGGRSICITGHSRFRDEDGAIIPMPDRTLGGFKVDDVIQELALAIRYHGISYIEFWCCETACSEETKDLDGGSRKGVVEQCSMKTFAKIRGFDDAKTWSHLSTLQYVCLKLSKILYAYYKETWVDYALHITGLNGVGYITASDRQIVTFDQVQMLKTVKDIGALEEKIGTKAEGTHDAGNLKLAEGRLRNHIAARRCHYISMFIDTAVIRRYMEKQAEKAARKAEEDAKGSDGSSGSPGLPKGPDPGPGTGGAGLTVGAF
ncbi:hypothetical protein [Paraburkholderia pallida]|uniref:Uncharacterized protein n=1 Tax=Paraburkholderia pallida TaxID=2547399 RepID=A0A4P7D943_9BURK|nr:hypothetical protein [Paraburkholderia pallida]QBR03555.1 hypothetical protein E1956_41280 [Paraburkholderia pallida]